jgi:flagellar hook protein FlgE
MPNFSIPLSGLKADNTELNAISNNLANMSTTAYKTQTVNFADMFYESMGSSGSGNPIAVGTGTQVASTSTDYTTGDFNTTGKTSSDMAVNGSGYFVVADASGSQYLTRNGAFTEDTTGHLVTSNGQYLMGYAATNGSIAGNSLSEIVVPTSGSSMAASASTSFTLTTNLSATDATAATYTSTANLYDSLGVKHTATITYTKTATNDWNYSVTLPDSDYASGTATAVTGTLTFDASGNLATVDGSTVGTATGDVKSVTLSGLGSGLADGASLGTSGNITWNLLSTTNSQILTQTSSADSNSATLTDGYTSGSYESFTVDTDGTVKAVYSNSQKLTVGQVALASVANQQGLQAEGNSLYQTTTASGTATVGTPGTGVLGTIKDSATEGSNVDISTQFSELIIAQRAFQANSKSITTFDTVTETAINLIR